MPEFLFASIARGFPHLELKLRRAGMYETPNVFAKKTLMMAFYLSAAVTITLFMFLSKTGNTVLLVPIFPILFFMLFMYMMRFPDAKILKRAKEVNKEIVFAGRFITIEIESGVTLYDTMRSVGEHYMHVGRYFRNILQKVDMGTSMEDAINEEIELVPSENLKRLMWQMINAIRTGGDMTTSLQSVITQISKEQFIEVTKYGRKLNPLAMFYMMMAVIIPSLGITMLAILSSFIDLDIGLGVLLILAGLLSFVQFMFLSMVKFSRPAVEL